MPPDRWIMSTVYAVMKKCREMSVVLARQYSVQTMDHQLYSNAMQVMWGSQESFSNQVMRLGGFHTHRCFISVIGMFRGDGGINRFF